MLFREVTYIQQVRPPTLKQFLWRKYVQQEMAKVNGILGTEDNPKLRSTIPKSAVIAGNKMRGVTSEQLAVSHPGWVKEYYGLYRRDPAGASRDMEAANPTD